MDEEGRIFCKSWTEITKIKKKSEKVVKLITKNLNRQQLNERWSVYQIVKFNNKFTTTKFLVWST